MTTMLKELEVLGMTKNEARVYESLAKYGPCRAGVLIVKLDVHRNIVYQVLDALIAKGYATKIEHRGVWEFQITDPHALLANVTRREEVARMVVQELLSQRTFTSRQTVVYEGIESYRHYWLSSLERAPSGTVDYVAGGDIEHWSQFLGTLLNTYWELCRKKNISWCTLYFGITKSEKALLKHLPIPYEARNWNGILPKKFLGNFNLIHDTVILHTMSDSPRVIEIRDEAIVPMFQNYFDIMWSQAEVVAKQK